MPPLAGGQLAGGPGVGASHRQALSVVLRVSGATLPSFVVLE